MSTPLLYTILIISGSLANANAYSENVFGLMVGLNVDTALYGTHRWLY